MAQVSANESAARRLVGFMRENGLKDLTALSLAITQRTERFMRRAIEQVPDGEYNDRIVLDGFEQPLHIEVKITVKGDRIVVDYAGTSPQVAKGTNSVLNFIRAFTCYALKCLLAP